MIFFRYDESGFGEMPASRFRAALYEWDFRAAVGNLCGPQALHRLERRTLREQTVTYQEFIDLVSLLFSYSNLLSLVTNMLTTSRWTLF